MISVGAFILDEIQLTPWYLTTCYNTIKNEKQFGGMFKLSGLGDPSGIGEGFSYLPRPQKEAGRTFKEVFPTLPPALQEIIGDTPPFKMSVPKLNDILKYMFTFQRRLSVHRLSTAGYETNLDELLKLTRMPKKQRVQALLDVESGEVRTGAGVQEYIRTCNRIWNKQVRGGTGQGLGEVDCWPSARVIVTHASHVMPNPSLCRAGQRAVGCLGAVWG